MNILVIGLGLIGGSFCKALSTKTSHSVYGYDIDKTVTDKAIHDKSIISRLEPDQFGIADITLICLHPEATIKFIEANASKLRRGSIVTDMCGIKANIVAQMSDASIESGLRYIGAHPMAGREFGGYDYSVANLYENRSFIVTPVDDTDTDALNTVTSLARETGFTRIITATPQQHDKTIAYTSQLAHIVSSAYVKSPSIKNESGFTAGSFQDMTRIATLNENMWTELFMQNRKPLIDELTTLINNLSKYRDSLLSSDSDGLKELLREGRIIKETDLSTYSK